MPPTRPKAWAGIVDGVRTFARVLAFAVNPPPALSVSEWAQAKRRVSPESGSPYPGNWSNDLVPYAVEPMDCLSFSHPCRDVTFKKSHQVGGTEIGVNLFGYREHPGEFLAQRPRGFELERVPAAEILHLFVRQRPGQVPLLLSFSNLTVPSAPGWAWGARWYRTSGARPGGKRVPQCRTTADDCGRPGVSPSA